MSLTLNQVKQIYRFQITEFFTGEKVVSSGKCSKWARQKELKQEKDLIYIQLKISYLGSEPKSLIFSQFHLEDSEGYFSDAMPPEDYLEATVSFRDETCGGLIFSLYEDITPSRLWFTDTNQYP
jgi:hypothetical protein